MKEKTIKLVCAGCGIPFDAKKKYYDQKKKWGQKEFYHAKECRNKSSDNKRLHSLSIGWTELKI